ncbi:MAG: hypothetical protein GC159_17640 [Phycisphaera sp.]|nr:hypothetical protein [Phycisphaera sp.]
MPIHHDIATAARPAPFRRRVRLGMTLCLLVAACLCVGVTRADEPDPAKPDAAKPDKPAAASPAPQAARPLPKPSVFDLPEIQRRYVNLQAIVLEMFRVGRYADAERICGELTKMVPHDPVARYNLACAQAQQGRLDAAFASLNAAIDRGFTDTGLMIKDDDLKPLREGDNDRFAKCIESAKARAAAGPPDDPWRHELHITAVADGLGTVVADNTAYDKRIVGFRTMFILPPMTDEQKARPPIVGFADVGKLVNGWYAAGAAAGNHGDFYDNHDGDHSNMRYQTFPQLTRIEFDEEVRKRQMHTGLQNHFLYTIIPGPADGAPPTHNVEPHAFGAVIGNSSTAMTRGPMWRSMTRLAYTDPRSAALLYTQYVSNHLYFYPEHRDHDPGTNGNGGYGDVFPANTPYVITSQGSSGSDRAFMDAVVATLAAFRPAVKQRLIAEHALMPTVQMIFRKSNAQVREPGDYFTGAAHPSVFEGSQLDVTKMVTLAHAIEPGAEPPVANLRVIEEDVPQPGVDYLAAPGRSEQLFDTPGAIARIGRSLKRERRIVLDAGTSRDVNGRPLTFRWELLRGDPARVKIHPLDATGTRAEVIVAHHERRPIAPGSDMLSPRVDVGLFVSNGVHDSAPAFFTCYFPDNERRVYDDAGRLVSVEYTDDYVDPMIAMFKDWKDVYAYADDGGKAGAMTGWTRTYRDGRTERYDAEGRLVTPDGAIAVLYMPQARNNLAPMLKVQPVANAVSK